jgi:hypothetical protein
MAEARAAVEVERVEGGAAASPSVWTRLRRALLVPGLALAGAAALVLLVLVPVERAGEPQTVAQADERSSARASDEPVDEPRRAGARSEPAATPIEAARDGADKLDAALEEKTAAAPTVSLAEPEAEEAAKVAESPPPSAVGGAPAGATTTTAADTGTSPRWDIIARGDRARQKANCTLARKEYEQALGDADARVRARAHAGIGLCQAWTGDAEGAADSYARARELDPEIAKFIEEERPRGARPPQQAKPAKKSKAAAKPAPSVDPSNAFEE